MFILYVIDRILCKYIFYLAQVYSITLPVTFGWYIGVQLMITFMLNLFPIFSHFVCNNAFILIKSVHFEIIVFDTIFTNILSIPIIWSIFPVQVDLWNFQKSSFEHNLFHQLWFTNITNELLFLVVNQINSSVLCYIVDSIYTFSQISHCNLRK